MRKKRMMNIEQGMSNVEGMVSSFSIQHSLFDIRYSKKRSHPPILPHVHTSTRPYVHTSIRFRRLPLHRIVGGHGVRR